MLASMSRTFLEFVKIGFLIPLSADLDKLKKKLQAKEDAKGEREDTNTTCDAHVKYLNV